MYWRSSTDVISSTMRLKRSRNVWTAINVCARHIQTHVLSYSHRPTVLIITIVISSRLFALSYATCGPNHRRVYIHKYVILCLYDCTIVAPDSYCWENKRKKKIHLFYDVRIERLQSRAGSGAAVNTVRGVFATPETAGVPAALVARAVAHEILLERDKTYADGGDETP